MKRNCPMKRKMGQVVQAYAVKAIPTSSIAPTKRNKGKGIIVNLECMLSFFNIPVRVLFDTGASRSFIYSDLISRLLCHEIPDPRVAEHHDRR